MYALVNRLFSLFGRKYQNFDAVLQPAPGPSPWHFRTNAPVVFGSSGRYRWSDARADLGEADGATGKTLLRDSAGTVRLVLDFHCYARQPRKGELLCWYALDHNVPSASDSVIHIRLIGLDRLPLVDDLVETFQRMKLDGRPMWPQNGDIAQVTIPLTLEDGKHTFNFPDALHCVEEMLILGHAVRDGRTSNFDDEMHLCIYAVRPTESTVEVIPQNWFNRAGLDYSYQWVTRVARDPQTRRIFGEGIRIRRFVLNASGRNVAAWR